MNIQEAKDCIEDAVKAYLEKDAGGSYVVPRNRQRPLVVMGPPGLGKTAIMSQIASELGIGYVGYAMTHHTRQSAIGLPMIDKAVYGGVETSITRYTMSEIIASVYDTMESKGKTEGILFIDEVNCVSETLSAAMLDLLQNKKFGPHRIPDGWVLVAAGNPPEFNSSARELDIATLDRVRLINVEPDAKVWIRYAMSAGIHPAITYYLQTKPQNLLSMENTPSGPEFVTPRAWEDLSVMMRRCDDLGLSIDSNLITQYVRSPGIAAEFKRYLDFHRKYSTENDVGAVLEGSVSEPRLKGAGPEERLSVIAVMIGTINGDAEHGIDSEAALEDAVALSEGRTDVESLRRSLSGKGDRTARYRISALSEYDGTEDWTASHLPLCRREASESHDAFEKHLRNAVEYLRTCFGNGQEIVSLLSGLLGCLPVVMYSRPGGALYGYNDELLSRGRDRRIESLLEASE